MSADFSWVPEFDSFESAASDMMTPSDPYFSSAAFAGTMILSNLTTARECVEKESNYIALMEFDHDIEEAIEKLTALRSFAVERVSHIRNLSLLEAA